MRASVPGGTPYEFDTLNSGGFLMFRGRSENKDNSHSRPPRKTKADPRSTETGKKIRRIDASGAGTGRPSDQTEIGGPPSAPPTVRSNGNPAASGNQVGGQDADGGNADQLPGGLADRAPSLPPLRQPTSDIPRIPVAEVSPEPSPPSAFDGPPASDAAVASDGPTAVVTPASQSNEGSGVFGEDRQDSAAPEARVFESAARAGVDAEVDVGADVAVDAPELAGAARFAGVGAASATGAVAAAMAAGDPFDQSAGGQQAVATTRTAASTAGDATRPLTRQSGGPSASAHAGSTVAGYGRSGDPEPLPHKTRQTNSGRGSGERPQDTEFKLTGGDRRQKPKEPNRLLLGLGLGLILLLGAAGAWYFTRDSGSDGVAAGDDTESVATDTSLAEGDAEAAAPAVTEPPAEPAVDEPTLFFDAATTGPLTEGETYSIDLVGEPEGSTLQVIVDDIPQGEPDALLPDLILPAGRHSLYIQITNGAEVTASTPVELYVQGDPPPQGFRANLSSVDQQTEGWDEAIRQFDEFRAAGHEGLRLHPISPGYWNLFIGDLGEERAAAQQYCESFGLAVPDDCFPTYYESPAGAATTETTVAADAATDAADESADDTDSGADGDADGDVDGDVMTDGEDTTSTTVAGG